MKTLEEILKQEPVYLGDFTGRFDLIANFTDVYITEDEYYAEKCPYNMEELWNERKEKMSKSIKEFEGINILFATYNYSNYEGDCFVLLEKDGKLFEVHGSHCSCYGLEGQFDLEEANLEELKHRLENGDFGDNKYSDHKFKKELVEFLGI